MHLLKQNAQADGVAKLKKMPNSSSGGWFVASRLSLSKLEKIEGCSYAPTISSYLKATSLRVKETGHPPKK